jgi:ribonuclease HI
MSETHSTRQITIYTDGAARGNPGPGGYGVLLRFGSHAKELSGGYRHTTNNRMELMAVIVALQALKTTGIPVIIFTDSRYVADTISKGWLTKWVATDFKGGKKNKDLWLQYHQLSCKFSIQMKWVKGHADNPFNNRCDELATTAADSSDLPPDLGYEKEVSK